MKKSLLSHLHSTPAEIPTVFKNKRVIFVLFEKLRLPIGRSDLPRELIYGVSRALFHPEIASESNFDLESHLDKAILATQALLVTFTRCSIAMGYCSILFLCLSLHCISLGVGIRFDEKGRHFEMMDECELAWHRHLAELAEGEHKVYPLENESTWNVSTQHDHLDQEKYRNNEGGTHFLEYAEEVYLTLRTCTHNQCTRICQTGLNFGISAVAFLCATNSSKVKLHSFDIADHDDYIYKAMNLTHKHWPDRHILTTGDSSETIPRLISDLEKPSEYVIVRGLIWCMFMLILLLLILGVDCSTPICLGYCYFSLCNAVAIFHI